MDFSRKFEDAEICILGVPFDATETYRRGARFGPESIRGSSLSVEEYSPELDLDLGDLMIADLGDIEAGDVKETLGRIEDKVYGIVGRNKLPVVLGGEHLISLGAVRALKEKYKDLRVIQFDAHLDLRDEYEGERLSHSTVMRRIYDICNDLYQIGIRSGSREEFDFAKENTRIYGADDISASISDVIEKIGDKPVYVSIDIDVLDPAYAPGTSNPEPCGISTRELMDAVHKIGKLGVVGFDVVEVCPGYDKSEVTPITAAKIVREGILSFFG